MLGWFRRRGAPPKASRVDAALAEIEDVSRQGGGSVAPSRLYDALRELAKAGALDMHRARVLEQLAAWSAGHPFEVRWDRTIYFRVTDPLGQPIEQLLADGCSPTPAPWAAFARSLAIELGGAAVFENACMVKEVLQLLRHPHAPARVEQLTLHNLDWYEARELDELVEELCTSARLATLRHFSIRAGHGLTSDHFERLARAPWAASLETLDLTEQMVDWSVDLDAAERARTWRALGRFQGLTHLVMYSNLHETADVAILLETTFPRLTHLNLGCGPKTDDFLALVADGKALPSLKELCLGDGPPRTSSAWDRVAHAAFAVYLHGARVSDEYPKRR